MSLRVLIDYIVNAVIATGASIYTWNRWHEENIVSQGTEIPRLEVSGWLWSEKRLEKKDAWNPHLKEAFHAAERPWKYEWTAIPGNATVFLKVRLSSIFIFVFNHLKFVSTKMVVLETSLWRHLTRTSWLVSRTDVLLVKKSTSLYDIDSTTISYWVVCMRNSNDCAFNSHSLRYLARRKWADQHVPVPYTGWKV